MDLYQKNMVIPETQKKIIDNCSTDGVFKRKTPWSEVAPLVLRKKENITYANHKS